MKKCLVLILSVIAAFTAMISLTACEAKVDKDGNVTITDGDKSNDNNNGGSGSGSQGGSETGGNEDSGKLSKTEIRSKNLTVSGNEIKGKVANAQTTFSFINDIEVADGATYTVCTDLACTKPVLSKTISLIDGDNVCYILVTNGNDINLYTVTVRRRPMYTVAFNSNGGTEIKNQQVEEDSLATKPADTEKTGYEFKGYDYDFNEPIVENTTINANWQIITYKISYILNGGINNADNPTTYTVEDTVDLKPSASNKSGYSFASWDNGGVIEKGSTGDKTFTANYTADVKLSSDGTTVTGLNNAVSDLVILSEYNGVKVTSIGDSAFNNSFSLMSITIPNSVTSIGAYAFSYGYSLTSITIPDSVISIGDSAFEYCPSLTSITIPDSVTSIGSWAFCGCSSLTSITIPDSVTYIGDSTFENCTSLKYNEYDNACYLGNNINPFVVLIKIKSKGITDCNISEKCKFICDYAFSGCTSLTSLIIPDSVTSIGSRAFYECSKLTSVTIGAGVTSIGNRAFADCTSLTSVTIPNHVMSIGNYTFDGCTSLTNIVIPDSVTSIGDYAFEDCISLSSITIGNGVTSIGGYVFSKCNSLTTIYYKGTERQWNSISKSFYWNFGAGRYTINYNYS